MSLGAVLVMSACLSSPSSPSSTSAASPSGSTTANAKVATKAAPTTPRYPDPVTWGRKALKDMGAVGRWEFTDAVVTGNQLDVATPLYDKESNRGPGPAMGLCVMFTEYGQANHLQRVVIHASNSAPLASTESEEVETFSRIVPAWTCHEAG